MNLHRTNSYSSVALMESGIEWWMTSSGYLMHHVLSVVLEPVRQGVLMQERREKREWANHGLQPSAPRFINFIRFSSSHSLRLFICLASSPGRINLMELSTLLAAQLASFRDLLLGGSSPSYCSFLNEPKTSSLVTLRYW